MHWPGGAEERLSKARWQKSLRRIPSGPRINPKRFPERPPDKSQAISRAAPGKIPSDIPSGNRIYAERFFLGSGFILSILAAMIDNPGVYTRVFPLNPVENG